MTFFFFFAKKKTMMLWDELEKYDDEMAKRRTYSVRQACLFCHYCCIWLAGDV